MRNAFVIGVVMGVLVAFASSSSFAAPPQDQPGDGACGAVNVLTATPTLVSCDTILPSKTMNSCAIQNLGPNAIYCNFANMDGGGYLLDAGSVASVNWGIQLAPNGGNWTFDMHSVAGSSISRKKIYCQAKTADQTTGETNTRYCGVR